MKAMLLNGAAAEGDRVDRLAGPLVEILTAEDMLVDRVDLYKEAIAWCTGCFDCWSDLPGRCRIDDAGQDLAAQARRADLLVLLTEVVFGGYHWQLKKALDRLLPNLAEYFLDEGTSDPTAGLNFTALLGIGVLGPDDPEAAALFTDLVQRNAANYHSWRSAGLVVDPRIDADQLADRVGGSIRSMEVLA
jgi:hypothetical protein